MGEASAISQPTRPTQPAIPPGSVNPLMMGYKGGDLLLTGAAQPTVGWLPRPVCAGCGQWPGWPAAPVSDESALEVA